MYKFTLRIWFRNTEISTQGVRARYKLQGYDNRTAFEKLRGEAIPKNQNLI